MGRSAFVIGIVAMLSILQAHAQQASAHPQPACEAPDAGLRDELEAWRSKSSFAAVGMAAQLANAELELGSAVRATLLQTPNVEYPVQPEKPGGSVSHGGLFSFKVTEPGTYSVALSTPAWIELVKDGKAIPAGAFGHGPECTTIRKIVAFSLGEGIHTLEVAGNGTRDIDLLVLRKNWAASAIEE